MSLDHVNVHAPGPVRDTPQLSLPRLVVSVRRERSARRNSGRPRRIACAEDGIRIPDHDIVRSSIYQGRPLGVIVRLQDRGRTRRARGHAHA